MRSIIAATSYKHSLLMLRCSPERLQDVRDIQKAKPLGIQTMSILRNISTGHLWSLSIIISCEPRKINPLTFYYTGCLIGIPISWFITIPTELASIISSPINPKQRGTYQPGIVEASPASHLCGRAKEVHGLRKRHVDFHWRYFPFTIFRYTYNIISFNL